MKKRMGRPKVPLNEAKHKLLSVRLTPDEYQQVRDAVKKTKLTQSQWIRKKLLGDTKSD